MGAEGSNMTTSFFRACTFVIPRDKRSMVKLHFFDFRGGEIAFFFLTCPPLSTHLASSG